MVMMMMMIVTIFKEIQSHSTSEHDIHVSLNVESV